MKNRITMAALSALANDDIENFLVASTPGGIEAQEARGQRDFVQSELLPKEYNPGGDSRTHFEPLGFVFGGAADDLFYRVVFPAGWTRRPTEHSMWTDILDDKGRKRACVFYEAAFYNRSAFVTLVRRYSVGVFPADNYTTNQTYDQRSNGEWFGRVIDTATGDVVWQSKPLVGSDYPDQRENIWARDSLDETAKAWADENLPDWRSELAYWD